MALTDSQKKKIEGIFKGSLEFFRQQLIQNFQRHDLFGANKEIMNAVFEEYEEMSFEETVTSILYHSEDIVVEDFRKFVIGMLSHINKVREKEGGSYIKYDVQIEREVVEEKEHDEGN